MRAGDAGSRNHRGGGGNPPSPATPVQPEPATPPPEPEKSWAVSAEHFADLIANRSQPFAWDRITAGNVDDVRVSIGGKELPFTSSAYQPAFDSDFSGAEWEIDAEVSPGAVVLKISAENQRFDKGDVGAVTITNPGSGYTSAPGVTFGPAPGDGETATGAAELAGPVTAVSVDTAGSGYTSPPTVTFEECDLAPCLDARGTAALAAAGVASVTVGTAGSGYTSAPSVSFSGGGGGGSGATATAALASRGVASVTITSGGSGYRSVPTVIFAAPTGSGAAATGTATVDYGVGSVRLTDRGSGYVTAPSVTFGSGGGGTGAAATATLRGPRGNTESDNVYWAQQTLYGKQLRIRIEQD